MQRDRCFAVATLRVAMALPLVVALAAPPKARIGEWSVDTAGLSGTVKPGDEHYLPPGQRARIW